MGGLRATAASSWWASRATSSARQDPGSNEEIASFCQLNYGVSFPMMAKVDVNGAKAHPLWQVAHRRGAGAARQQGHQVELHQVPGRPGRQGDQALCAHRQARSRCARTSKRRLAACPQAPLDAEDAAAMFQHVEPYAGDPILEPERGLPEGPAAAQGQPVDRHLLRRRRAASRCCDSVRRAEAQIVAAGRAQALPADRRRGQLPPRGAAAAVRRRARGDGERPHRHDPVGGLERRPEGRRRLHPPLLPGQRGLGQRPDLGQPPRDVRRRRLAVHTYPYYDAATGGVRFDAMLDALRTLPAAQRRAAARLLPQPDRGRPDARAVGRADPAAARARAAALPGPRLPGLSATASTKTPRGAARWPTPGCQLLHRQLVLARA